jgi:tetratricopeptide (TPR) repeat protein
MTRYIVAILLGAIGLMKSGLVNAHQDHNIDDIEIELVGNLGSVDFKSTCSHEASQAINTGLALLHHMMYAQAKAHFGKWVVNDPKCAILYWGYSMTLFHPLWPDTISKESLIEGQSKLQMAMQLSASPRETAYIKSAYQYYNSWQHTPEKQRISNWHLAQQQLHKNYPNDVDAATLYALSKLAAASKKDPTYQQQKVAGKLLERIFKANPKHPGVIHYLIHAYDNPQLASKAVIAADAYGQIAPDTPHALHMPSHIFVRLGLWDKAAEWNERSANAALKNPVNGLTSLHYAHAADYLVYSYLQTNSHQEVNRFIKELHSHHPFQPTFPVAYALTAIPARVALEDKNWQAATQLPTESPSYINWKEFPQIEAITYFSKGLGAAKSGDNILAQESLDHLERLLEITSNKSPKYWGRLVLSQMLMVKAWISYDRGDRVLALELSRQAADIEDSLEKDPVTPGPVLPARELFADMLMLDRNYELALFMYQKTLQRSPNRKNSLAGMRSAKAKLNSRN